MEPAATTRPPLLPEASAKAIGRTPRASGRGVATISACSRAILLHHGIDPLRVARIPPAPSSAGGIAIRDVRAAGDHLTMTILLPMPYGTARMTVTTDGATDGAASITLPGMSLSPAIAAAAIGCPVGRLTGHPAFDALDDLPVTAVEQATGESGRGTTILRFTDFAEPLGALHGPPPAALQ